MHSGEIVISQECVDFCICVLCYFDHRSSFISLCKYCIACYKFLFYLIHNVGHSFVLYVGDAVSIDDFLQFLAAKNWYGSCSLTSKSRMALSASVTKVGRYDSVGFSILYWGP